MSLPLPPKALPLPPPLPMPPARADHNDPWTIEKEDYNRGYVHVNGSYDRLTLFRLIGQLERMAATL